MLVKTATFCLLLITSFACFSEAAESEILKVLEHAGRKCFAKLDVNDTATTVSKFRNPEDALESDDTPDIVCALYCLVSELGLDNETLSECSEPDDNLRRQRVSEWIETQVNTVTNIETIFNKFLIKVSPNYSARYMQLIRGAGQKCGSNFDLYGAKFLSALFNPLQWPEEIMELICSFECMLIELNIIDGNGLNRNAKEYAYAYSLILFDVRPEKVNEAEESAKPYIEKLNAECRAISNSI